MPAPSACSQSQPCLHPSTPPDAERQPEDGSLVSQKESRPKGGAVGEQEKVLKLGFKPSIQCVASLQRGYQAVLDGEHCLRGNALTPESGERSEKN